MHARGCPSKTMTAELEIEIEEISSTFFRNSRSHVDESPHIDPTKSLFNLDLSAGELWEGN